jgi:hypothetical protein
MAQTVGYYENNVQYTEGPFVVTTTRGRWYRIEAQKDGHQEPVIPEPSIMEVIYRLGGYGSASRTAVCDTLNRMVRTGQIVKTNGVWVKA